MHPGVQAFRRLCIDSAFSHHAPERGLNVLAGATEPVVQIKVPERGIKVVAPQKVDDTPSQPDALRVAGGTAHLRLGLGKFIGPPL